MEDSGVDGRKVLKWNFKKWETDMDWIDMTQDRDRRQALMNAVINFRGISLLAEHLLASQEALCSRELVSCGKRLRHLR